MEHCRRCDGLTLKGTQCIKFASCRKGCYYYCWQHAPEYQAKTKDNPSHCVNVKIGHRPRAELPVHLKLPPAHMNDGVYVAPSTIPQAGRGLFAARSFSKGDVVTTFGGAVMWADEWSKLPAHMKNYAKKIREHNLVIDGRVGYGKQLGRWINHATGSKANVTWGSLHKRDFYMPIYAKRDIRAGEELFINYGKGFAQTRGLQ